MLLLLACAQGPTAIEVDIQPSELDLGSLSIAEEVPAATKVVIANHGQGPVYVSPLPIEGDGAGAVVVVEPPELELLGVGDTLAVMVGPSQTRLNWDDGLWDLLFEVQADAAVNQKMGAPYEPYGQPEILAIPVTVEVDCDIDDDGYEHKSCGGDDCNDQSDAQNPGATEKCGNPLDEDCSGDADACE